MTGTTAAAAAAAPPPSLMRKLERDTLQRQCKKEVEELHQLFVAWFQGTRSQQELEEELERRLQYSFSHVAPNGQFLLGRKVLLQHLQDKYACYRERVFQIDIHNVQLLWNDDDESSGAGGSSSSSSRCLCTYEEWQSWKQVTDEATGQEGLVQFGRLSTCLLEKQQDEETDSQRLTWVHVHETWLEAEAPPVTPAAGAVSRAAAALAATRRDSDGDSIVTGPVEAAAAPAPPPPPASSPPSPLRKVKPIPERRPTDLPRHQSDDEGTPPKLLVLISSQDMSPDQVSHQRQVAEFLETHPDIPHEEVDGADFHSHDRREALFDVSGIRGKYPQFFIQQYGKDNKGHKKGNSNIVFWGDYDTFKASTDAGTIEDDLAMVGVVSAGVNGDGGPATAANNKARAKAAPSDEGEEEGTGRSLAAALSEGAASVGDVVYVTSGVAPASPTAAAADAAAPPTGDTAVAAAVAVADATALSPTSKKRVLVESETEDHTLAAALAAGAGAIGAVALTVSAADADEEEAEAEENEGEGEGEQSAMSARQDILAPSWTRESTEPFDERGADRGVPPVEDVEDEEQEEGDILVMEPEEDEEARKPPPEERMSAEEEFFLHASQGILVFEEEEEGGKAKEEGDAVEDLNTESPIPQDVSPKRHMSPKLHKYAQPLKWENALVGISIAGFDIGTSQGPIGDEVWFKETGDSLEELSQSRSIPRPRRKICLPEMVFPTAHVALEGHGFWMSWDAIAALEEWARCHHEIAIHSRISHNGVSVMRARDAKLWDEKRKHGEETQGVSSIFHYDWTFSTPFCGTVEGGTWTALDESGMNLSLLTDQSVPILFYDEILLYEDDLHDNGQVQYVVKLRVMPTCCYVLARLWLRVDQVMVRVRETRVLIDLFGRSPQVYRDVCWRECMWGELAANKLPTEVKEWCFDGRETPAWNELLKALPECNLPKGISKHAVLQHSVDSEASVETPAEG